MTIETLLKVAPPPAKPTHVFTAPWEVIEEQLRTRLPQDYKDLMRVYGSGKFVDLFGIYHPLGQTKWDSIVYNALMLQRSSGDCRLPIYPMPGGLLVCGLTDDGAYICWLTRGATPEEWPIVLWDVRPRTEEEEFTMFECDLTDFIAGVLTTGILHGGEDQEDIDWLKAQKPFESY